MLYDKTLNCPDCGKSPKLKKSTVDSRISTTKTKYVLYSCECGTNTFATAKEEFCRELWNAGVEYKIKKKNKIK